MGFSIQSGERNITFDIPDTCRVRKINPRAKPPMDHLKGTVKNRLNDPTAGPPIKELVQKGDRIALICDDHTRPTPVKPLLEALLDELFLLGIRKENIRIFPGYGLHPPMGAADLEKKLGRTICETVSIEHHNAHHEASLTCLGKTRSGTPVYVNRSVLEADVRIGIGNISLSKEAGYGGGAKVIMPGVCGAQTIYGSHGKVRWHPNQMGRIDGNPVRDEIEEVGRMAGLDFIINTVLNENDEIADLVTGDPLKAFAAGIQSFNRLYRFHLDAPLDIILAGSRPYDFEFYQANKAVSAASLGVRDGGTIILVSPCERGISPFPYFDEMVTSGRDFFHWREYLGDPSSRHKVAGEICLSLRYLMDVRNIKVGMVTEGISMKTVSRMGITPHRDVDAAIKDALIDYGPHMHVGILPKAPMTLLSLAPEKNDPSASENFKRPREGPC